MCGIAGILTDRQDLDLSTALDKMLAALRHRGPDDEGRTETELPGGRRLGLAQARLSIIDLTPAGHQPMHDPESGSWIAYNGEVYNHQDIRRRLTPGKFLSTSDTATILRGWAETGDGVLRQLRGMFAFGLYDGRRQHFWLVRDRLGIKPLYVSQSAHGTWVFASELRALLASGLVARRLNPMALESYLAFGAVAAPWTMVEKITSLLPGESWQFDLNDTEAVEPVRRRYWRPAFVPRSGLQLTYDDAVEHLRPVLLEAIKLRMLADVPVGIFLSGGIDSSAIVAALSSQGYTPRTFSVVFSESDYDESKHSRLVARWFGCEHMELFLRPRRVLAEFEQAVGAYDQPSIDGMNTYFIAQATRHAGVKVALSGLGGDELFAGYPYFRMLSRLERGPQRRMAALVHGLLRWAAPRSTRTTKLGAILQGSGLRVANYAVCRSVMDSRRRATIFGYAPDDEIPLPAALSEELEAAARDLDPVNAHSLLEISLYMANMLLRDTDQMSMAHSLEVRDPLLDYVLVETVGQIPGHLKLARGRRNCAKALLIDALPAALPEHVLRRPKMGFVFPWEHWLRNELRSRVEKVLTDSELLAAVALNSQAVQQLWHNYLRGKPGLRYTDILSLVHLLHWVGRHRLTLEQSGAAPAEPVLAQ
jgi:asparagine synthase (glutamine-hydrolysing)